MIHLNIRVCTLYFNLAKKRVPSSNKAYPKIVTLGNVIKAIYFLRLKRTVIEREARSYFSLSRFTDE